MRSSHACIHQKVWRVLVASSLHAVPLVWKQVTRLDGSLRRWLFLTIAGSVLVMYRSCSLLLWICAFSYELGAEDVLLVKLIFVDFIEGRHRSVKLVILLCAPENCVDLLRGCTWSSQLVPSDEWLFVVQFTATAKWWLLAVVLLASMFIRWTFVIQTGKGVIYLLSVWKGASLLCHHYFIGASVAENVVKILSVGVRWHIGVVGCGLAVVRQLDRSRLIENLLGLWVVELGRCALPADEAWTTSLKWRSLLSFSDHFVIKESKVWNPSTHLNHTHVVQSWRKLVCKGRFPCVVATDLHVLGLRELYKIVHKLTTVAWAFTSLNRIFLNRRYSLRTVKLLRILIVNQLLLTRAFFLPLRRRLFAELLFNVIHVRALTVLHQKRIARIRISLTFWGFILPVR